jgi:HK97 gp10 family phage protein
MANDVSFKIEGLDALIKRIGKLAPQIAKEVAMEVNASALAIQSKARRSVAANSIDKGRLVGSIQLKEINKGDKVMYTVGSRLKYAPYVEFGTGGRLVYLLDMKILHINLRQKYRKINLRPRPYLIPAFESEIPILRKNIQNVIKNVKS